MEKGKKKALTVCLAVGCLIVAGLITFSTMRAGESDIEQVRGQTVLMKCNECGASYEMDKADYYTFVRANLDPENQRIPPLKCKECGSKSAYKAVECGKCGEVFFENTVPNDFADRCPECGFSETEQARREAPR